MAIITVSSLVSYTPQMDEEKKSYSLEEFFRSFYIEQVGYLAKHWVEHAINNAQSFEEKQEVISHGLYQLKEMANHLSSNIAKTISFEANDEKEFNIYFSFIYVEPQAYAQFYPTPEEYVKNELILGMKEMAQAMIEKAATENKVAIYQLYTYLDKLLTQMENTLLIKVS
jgi:hypothetical protein